MIPLIVFMFVAAAEPDVVLPIACDGDLCIVPREVVKAMMDAHNDHVEAIRKLEEQIRHPKCAETKVVEPPKCETQKAAKP